MCEFLGTYFTYVKCTDKSRYICVVLLLLQINANIRMDKNGTHMEMSVLKLFAVSVTNRSDPLDVVLHKINIGDAFFQLISELEHANAIGPVFRLCNDSLRRIDARGSNLIANSPGKSVHP